MLSAKYPFLTLLFISLGCSTAANAQLTINGFEGLTASLSSDGAYSVRIPNLGWQFSGALGPGASNGRIANGSDAPGDYEELSFDYGTGVAKRSASIRAYTGRPLVIFAVTTDIASPNIGAFPTFSSYPSNLTHLSFNGLFSHQAFGALQPDSPWVYFDASANTFIVSPASDYLISATTLGSSGELQAGISSKIKSLPASFTHRTALAFGHGINQTFSAWGKA